MAKKHYLKVRAEFEVQAFIDDIYLDHDNDTLFALIAGLDEACADWDFTEKCRDYFVAQMEAKEIEMAKVMECETAERFDDLR